MKVKDLLRTIKQEQVTYGKDFLNWEIAVEHHRSPEKCVNCKDHLLEDGDGCRYIKVHGYNTMFVKEKVFTINIHY